MEESTVEMLQAFEQFKKATEKLNQAWSNYQGDLLFDRLYPFSQSFDDLTPEIIEWVSDAITNLKKI